MTEKEFRKLQVGDKVRIVKKKTGGDWNLEGKMDKWLGKVMTVRDIHYESARMKEDYEEGICGWGWSWTPNMIAEKIEDTTITEHIIKGNKTIVKLSNGKVGVAKCNPEDEFDVYEGLKTAIARAYGKEEEKKPEYFTGKVVCIGTIGPALTEGKIYEFKNGYSKWDDGDTLPIRPVKDINELNGMFHFSRFLEIKE